MNIGLINTYSYSNIGDAAIYSALLQMLKEHKVYSTLKQETEQTPLAIEYSQNISHCDRYISVGGDIFNNARSWFITRNFLHNLQQLKISPKNTFLFGQSIPASCQGFALKYLSHQLKQLSSVVVRDQQSYQLLTKKGINCSLSYDTAFILNCSQTAIQFAQGILTSLQVSRSAVISLREFNHLYPVDNKQFIRNMVSLCKQLKENGYQAVLLIQSKVSDLDSDWLIANEIKQQCPDVKVLDLFKYATTIPTWELLQAILKIAKVIIAVRYHTAVLALATGRTPFNLFYSNKGADLGLRLGIPSCHVEQFNPKQSFALIQRSGQKAFDNRAIVKSVQYNFHKGLNLCHIQNSMRNTYEHA